VSPLGEELILLSDSVRQVAHAYKKRLDKTSLQRVYFKKDQIIPPIYRQAMGLEIKLFIGKGSRKMTEQHSISTWPTQIMRLPMSMPISRTLMERCGSGRRPLSVPRRNS
jgi:hypothetical protein